MRMTPHVAVLAICGFCPSVTSSPPCSFALTQHPPPAMPFSMPITRLMPSSFLLVVLNTHTHHPFMAEMRPTLTCLNALMREGSVSLG